MANDITKNPLVIDTASGTAVLTHSLRIKKIRWVGGTTAGHTAIIQDQNSNLYWESICSGANYAEESDFTEDKSNRTLINGLKVPTLGSGKLEIYF
jgi:hypothetical protein